MIFSSIAESDARLQVYDKDPRLIFTQDYELVSDLCYDKKRAKLLITSLAMTRRESQMHEPERDCINF